MNNNNPEQKVVRKKYSPQFKDQALERIKRFDVVGSDERGLTAEFSLSRKQAEFVFITRKGKSVSGNTERAHII